MQSFYVNFVDIFEYKILSGETKNILNSNAHNM